MNYDWVEVDGLYSQVGWRKRPKATKAIVIIPGNPGLARFYEDFANHLHENIPNANTFIFSNLGAVAGGPKQSSKFFQNKENFLLFGQIRHKRRLIEKMIDPDLEIIMVSHSIGSFMMLHLMENRPMVTRAFGLMPTIENMEDAPEGQKMTFHFTHSILVISLVFYIIRLLPLFIRDFIVKVCTIGMHCASSMHIRVQTDKIYLQKRGNYCDCVHRTIRDEFLCGSVIWAVFFLAENEMALVKKRPDDLIKTNSDKLTLFYSQIDDWVPEKYYNQVIQDHPNLDVEIVEKPIGHAFVETHSIQMAEKILQKLKN